MTASSARSTVTSKGFPLEVRAKVVIAPLRRLPGQHRVAEAGLGPGGGELPDPRHPLRQGGVLKSLLGQGVASVGDPTQCHAVAIDGRAPKFDGGIATRLDCIPFSVVVNRHGTALLRRGRGCMAQALRHLGPPGGAAAGPGRLLHHRQPQRAPVHAVHLSRHQGGTIGELASKLGLDPAAVEATVAAFNAACQPGPFDNLPAGRAAYRRPRAAEDQLGPADHRAALHRLPAAARNHLHLPGREGERTGAGHHGRRQTQRRTCSHRGRSWQAAS